MVFEHEDLRYEIASTIRSLGDSQSLQSDELVAHVYERLGRSGLLAPHWPESLGGRGLAPNCAGLVLEELVQAGVPDTLFVNTILTVGEILLRRGDSSQHETYLKDMAAGCSFASVLYTEPDAGSDLGAISTEAREVPGGVRITGVKLYSLTAHVTEYGLCLFRMAGSSGYEGLSLAVIEMSAPGVSVSPLASVADTDFNMVEMDAVFAAGEQIIGTAGEGLSILLDTLTLERTGVDFHAKARHWFMAGLQLQSAARSRPTGGVRMLAELASDLDVGRVLSQSVLSRFHRGMEDDVGSAASRWFNGELAKRVGTWLLHETSDLPPDDPTAEKAWAAYTEAPGATLSGGTSEMMLRLVVAALCADPELSVLGEPRDAAIARALTHAFREGPDEAFRRLRHAKLDDPQRPRSQGGLGLSLMAAISVGEQLGEAGLVLPLLGSSIVRQCWPGEPVTNVQQPVVSLGESQFRSPGGLRLTGANRSIATGILTCRDWIGEVDHVLAPAVADGRDVALLLPIDQPGVSVRAGDGGTIGYCRIVLDEAEVLTRDVVLSAERFAESHIVMFESWLRHSAYLLGVTRTAVRHSITWALSRKTFGCRLIDSDAVSFPLASVLIRAEGLRAVCRDLAGSSPILDSAIRAVELLARSCLLGMEATQLAIQVWGARGMTLAAPTGPLYQIASTASILFGSPLTLLHSTGSHRFVREQQGSASE